MTAQPITEAQARAVAAVVAAARQWAELGWCASGYSRRPSRKPLAHPACECDWCLIVKALQRYDAASLP